MKYTKIPENTFKEIQMGAGILLSDFDPSDGSFEMSNIIGATTGGCNFTDTPSFIDYGEDIDNCPKNTMELKRLDNREVQMTGTFVTTNATQILRSMGMGDADSEDPTHLIPRDDIKISDFDDLWWVGDYSDKNEEGNAGFCAIHMMNTMSTGGFQIQTADKSKGQFPFTYTAHYSISAQDVVPYEVYLKAGA